MYYKLEQMELKARSLQSGYGGTYIDFINNNKVEVTVSSAMINCGMATSLCYRSNWKLNNRHISLANLESELGV